MKKNKYDYDSIEEVNEEELDKDDSKEEDSKLSFDSFLKNYKNDKKYRSKVQLVGYAVFIILLVMYLNISNMGKNYNYNNSNSIDNNTNDIGEKQIVSSEKESLFNSLKDNYTYNVDIFLKRLKEDNSEENLTINYNGKISGENLIINRVFNNITSVFYKAGDEYYRKNNDEYELMAENEIYDIISGKYIEYSRLKKYIDMAELDHYTNYSVGKVEYVYILNVSDAIKSYKKDNKIVINVIEENDIVTIDIDFTNLFKELNNKIIECKINYKYSDIGSTEKIVIFDEDNKKNETSN